MNKAIRVVVSLIATATLMTNTMAQDKAPELTIYAAGSLRAAMTQIAQDFAAQSGVQPKLVFGASGLLRDRLTGGERADLFASANMEHPQALERSGHAAAVRPFTRNELCALATAAFAADTRSLVAKLLDVAQGQADVFITYCTNATIALSEEPPLKSLPIDASINVSATYGVATMKGATPMAQRFLDHLLGPQGQRRLRALGFSE